MRTTILCAALSVGTMRAEDLEALAELPIRFHHHRVLVPARVGSSPPLHLLLDTAFTIPTLHPDVVDELQLTRAGSITIVGIAGEEEAPTYREVVFELGAARYAPRRVAAVPSERKQSRRRREGVLGSGFFERFVVEMDSRGKKVRLFDPKKFSYTGQGIIVPFTFRDEIPVIKAAIVMGKDEQIDDQFEIDTGCDSGLCLGAHFVEKHRLLEKVEGRPGAKFGVGGSAGTTMGTVPAIRLGELRIEEPQTDFFTEGSPVEPPFAGHIGMGVLGKKKLTFDYSRKQMIVEP